MSWLCLCLVEVERVAVEVGEHVILKHLLVAVQGELLAAHGADFPVALHMLLELALVIVGWEDDLAQRTPLHVHAADTERGVQGSDSEQGSDDVSSQRVQANKEHVFDAWWVACSWTNTNKREPCSRTNTMHMLQCKGLE